MANGKKVLVVSPGIPHPSRGASSVLFYYYVACLRKYGYSVLNVLLLEDGTFKDGDVEAYRGRFAGDTEIEILPLVAKGFLKSGRVTAELDESVIDPAITARMQEFRPDLVLCLDFLSARIVRVVFPASTPSKAVWLGDLNFETQWYHALYALRESRYLDPKGWYRLGLAWFRCRRIKSDYAKTLGAFRVIIASSKSGERRLARIGVVSTYLPYPWPEETSEVREMPGEKPTFLFLGTLAALGSRSAFHFMDGKFYRALQTRWGAGGFRIFVTGSSQIPAWAKEMFDARPEFEMKGFVDDLVGLMRTCHAVLVPIDVPVGNRSRVITAMANQTLVVAHRNVALGNPGLVDGETCHLADSASDFVRKMERAVANREEASEIIERARSCYDAHFAPDFACEHLHNMLLPLLRGPGRTGIE